MRYRRTVGTALGAALAVTGVVAPFGTQGTAATPARTPTVDRGAAARVAPQAKQAPSRMLFSVSAVSPKDAWAVGNSYRDQVTRTWILHWDGRTWTHVPSPNPSSPADEFTAVSAVSAHDAWAVGSDWDQGPLIARWNGLQWKQVAAAGLDQWDTLGSVSADSVSDAWAVGHRTLQSGDGSVAIIWHWDGSGWSQVPSPNGRLPYNDLTKVTATSATDAWAVGSTSNPDVNPYGSKYPRRPLVLHWNGTSWSRVSVPSPRPARTQIRAVSASSAGNAWAIGAYYGATTHQLLLRWDGTHWSQVPGRRLSAPWFLSDVSTVSRRDAWATGEWYPQGSNGPRKTLTLHWNGTRWSKVSSPSPLPDPRPWSVDATASDNAWAVGWHGRFVLILHWNGHKWTSEVPS